MWQNQSRNLLKSMSSFRSYFFNQLGTWRKSWGDRPMLRALSHLPVAFAFFGLLIVIFDIGFDQNQALQETIDTTFQVLFTLELIFTFFRYFFSNSYPPLKVWAFDILLMFGIGLTLLVLSNVWTNEVFESTYFMSFLFMLIFLRELSSERIELKKRVLNPAQFFILSFLAIIFLGAYSLMLPNATHQGITFIDALFTSTSAVCVTGLSVNDIGTYFTTFGQVVMLVLIQLGGLGIMTFTSYFSFFFSGESSYENQFLIQEMNNSDKVSDVFRALKRVLLLTFSIEALGAIAIFEQLNTSLLPTLGDKLFFSVFHSVSAFCNAGFSTLSSGFYDPGFRFNYPLHLSVAFLIILGGIGFPILFNVIQYFKYLIKHRLSKRNHEHKPWIINVNTRIVFATTFILLLVGTVFFYIFEYHYALAEHGALGKIVTSFFGAVTPRTAGFNTVNISGLHMTTIMLFMFLMWVGASPASTGGGIKTSTFAITIMNVISLANGRGKIELFGRQVSDSSIRRAYAQVFLSLLAIFTAFALVSVFDPTLSAHKILFECVSAFGTVGLSLGITAQLSDASKVVITILMYVGRVSMLTIFAAFLKQVRFQNYKYPLEDITIN